MRVVILGILLIGYLQIRAQENPVPAILQKAVAEYQTGRFGQVFQLLENEHKHWSPEERCQAFRILALTYLAADESEKCREMIRKMLEAEPYYTPALQDPLRFVRLVKEMQSGKTTLVTASQQQESPEEAPVPVIVITREMLSDIGARTLKDALLAYVPGMNHVESANEVNIAMRGVYSSGQQKILIMLNGHRLNSRSTNGANPDYSISLEKVKQIEILRGPASSLYGNVALTAVVNVITRDGNLVDGLEIQAGIGNWGQKQLNLLFGKSFMDADFVAWGTFFQADGQVVAIARERAVTDPFTVEQRPGEAIIGGYRDLPSYDVGFTCNRKGFSLLFNQRYCKQTDPFATVSKGQGSCYTYSRYRKIEGAGMGYGMANTHSELAWNGSLASWKINGGISFDLVRHNQLSASGDGVPGYVLAGQPTYNNMQLMSWQEFTLGGTVKAGYDYQAGKLGRGSVLMGVQAEHLNVYSSDCMLWRDFDVMLVQLDMLGKGKENSYSVFTQIKHHLPGHWIINGGVRGDYKVRANGKRIFAFSPRVSLIYLPGEKWSFKGSVSRAFVDAPYFYRYTSLPTFKADSLLRPEYLLSVQLSYGYRLGKRFHYEGNWFYNVLTDIIYRDKTILDATDKYKNAGLLKIAGWENTLRYTSGRLRGNLNLTALTALNRMENVCGEGRIYNIPSLTMTGVAAGCVLKKQQTEVWISADAGFTLKQASPIKNIYFGQGSKPSGITDETGAVNLPGYTLPSRWLVNAGVAGKWRKLSFSCHGYNVFNRLYSQGGSSLLPYPQPGRSVMVKIGIVCGKRIR